MIKKYFIYILLAFAILFLGGVSSYLFSAKIIDAFLPSSEDAEISISADGDGNTPALKNSSQKNDSELTLDCTRFNKKYSEDNVYLDEARLGSDPHEVVKKYLEDQDKYFSERFEELGGTSVECDLPRVDTSSVHEGKKISTALEFKEERQQDLQKVVCALEELRTSDALIGGCEVLDNVSLYNVLDCDRNVREHQIQKAQQSLMLSFELAMINVNEATVPWRLHKRIECLQEQLIDQREVLIEILQTFALFPGAFTNASTSN